MAGKSAGGTATAGQTTYSQRLYGTFLRSEALRGYTLISPTMIVMFIALAAPLILLVAYSLWTQTSPIVIDRTVTFDRYAEVFSRENYQILFIRTLTISGLVTLATVLIAYPIAYYVAFHVERTKFLWLVLLTIPFWTSYLLRIFAWRIILGYEGVINGTLIQLGIISESAPLDLLYNRTAVVIALAHAYAAFAVLPIYVSLEKIDRSLLEAADDLGDGPWRRFWRITFPLSLPGVIAAAVVIFVPTTGDYVTPILIGGGSSTMLANIIQLQFQKVNNWPLGAALALSSLAAVGIVVVFFITALRLAVSRIK